MRAALAAAAALALPACDPDCPGDPLEVRPFTGENVDGTSVTCDGERTARWFACTDNQASILLSPPPAGCDSAVRIRLGRGVLAGEMPVLWLEGEDALVSARIQVELACDEECATPPPPHLIAGHVSAQDFSATGRNRGRFEIQFEGGSISGTYDVDP